MTKVTDKPLSNWMVSPDVITVLTSQEAHAGKSLFWRWLRQDRTTLSS